MTTARAATAVDERIFAAFMAGICACQVARWIVIAVREFLRERKAKALGHTVLEHVHPHRHAPGGQR